MVPKSSLQLSPGPHRSIEGVKSRPSEPSDLIKVLRPEGTIRLEVGSSGTSEGETDLDLPLWALFSVPLILAEAGVIDSILILTSIRSTGD